MNPTDLFLGAMAFFCVLALIGIAAVYSFPPSPLGRTTVEDDA